MEPLGVRNDANGNRTLPGPVRAENLLGIQAAGAVGVIVLNVGERATPERKTRVHARTINAGEDRLIMNSAFQILLQRGIPLSVV